MRRAFIHVDRLALARALSLPEGVSVQHAEWSVRDDALVVTLEGDGLPVNCQVVAGLTLNRLDPRYQPGPPVFVGWGT